jgi:hypothetical protein
VRLASIVVLVACGSKPAPEVDGTCKVDADCIISCDIRGECCANPYCETVLHRDVAASNAAFNGRECTPEKREQCPDIGARANPTYRIEAKCRAGNCIGERITTDVGAGSATGGGSEVVDTSAYDKSCATAADCKIVKDDPCNPCSCGDKPIASRELDRFLLAAGSIKCGKRAQVVCSECVRFAADCYGGKCVAKPE